MLLHPKWLKSSDYIQSNFVFKEVIEMNKALNDR